MSRFAPPHKALPQSIFISEKKYPGRRHTVY
jgi:hypothetical protein